jgi:hypothetical protein
MGELPAALGSDLPRLTMLTHCLFYNVQNWSNGAGFQRPGEHGCSSPGVDHIELKRGINLRPSQVPNRPLSAVIRSEDCLIYSAAHQKLLVKKAFSAVLK